MFQAQNRETINSTWKVAVSFKIIMTTSVTRSCCVSVRTKVMVDIKNRRTQQDCVMVRWGPSHTHIAQYVLPSVWTQTGSSTRVPCGLWVERIDLLHFLAGCCKRQLNPVLSVLSLSLGFCVLCCSLQRLVCCAIFFVWFCLLVVLVRLSAPVQVTDWKDSSPKWPIMCWWGR